MLQEKPRKGDDGRATSSQRLSREKNPHIVGPLGVTAATSKQAERVTGYESGMLSTLFLLSALHRLLVAR
jgi:hypothetical protein